MPVDRATIYRTLETLGAEGLVHAVHSLGVKRYGIGSEPHHHSVCERCGRVGDLPIEHMRDAVERFADLAGLRSGAATPLVLYGKCALCGA